MTTEVRSVQRALLILRVMNERPTWSLQELHRRTGLAKSTLHRLLSTLESEKYVRTDPQAYGQYQLTLAVSNLSCGISERSVLAEMAAPLMIATTREIKWPLSLGVVDGHQIRVVFCTMPYSPYAIRSSNKGRHCELTESVLGLAYLPFCDAAERRVIVEAVNRREDGGPRIADMAALRRMVRQTRRQGYALRCASSAADGMVFAVPVFSRGHLRGALAYSGHMNERMLQQFVPVVRATADRIGEAVANPKELPGA